MAVAVGRARRSKSADNELESVVVVSDGGPDATRALDVRTRDGRVEAKLQSGGSGEIGWFALEPRDELRVLGSPRRAASQKRVPLQPITRSPESPRQALAVPARIRQGGRKQAGVDDMVVASVARAGSTVQVVFVNEETGEAFRWAMGASDSLAFGVAQSIGEVSLARRGVEAEVASEAPTATFTPAARTYSKPTLTLSEVIRAQLAERMANGEAAGEAGFNANASGHSQGRLRRDASQLLDDEDYPAVLRKVLTREGAARPQVKAATSTPGSGFKRRNGRGEWEAAPDARQLIKPGFRQMLADKAGRRALVMLAALLLPTLISGYSIYSAFYFYVIDPTLQGRASSVAVERQQREAPVHASATAAPTYNSAITGAATSSSADAKSSLLAE